MNNSNKRLGRGLEALIGSTTNIPNSPPSQISSPPEEKLYQEVSIDQINGNPRQPRSIFDEKALEELAESVKSVGLVQPVIVRKEKNGNYEIVAGERRWRAAKLAGLEKIPVVIREADDAESLELALIENLSREDLNPIDAARAYANLLEDFGTTQEELAMKLGRSRSAIANTMRLLDLPDEVQSLIEQGRLSEGHGRALLGINDRLKLRKAALKAAARCMSVRQVEELAKKENAGPTKKREPFHAAVGQEKMDEATDAIYSAFRLPVKVRWTARGGRIEIEFTSGEQLKHVIDVLESN